MKMRAIEIVDFWNKFKGKFGWSILQPEEIYLIPTIQPVTQIDDLLDNLKDIAVETAIDTSNIAAFTVPYGKKWTLIGVTVTRAETGACQLELDDPGSTSQMVFNKSSDTQHYHMFSPKITLDERWAVKITNGPGVSGAITTHLMYQERDAF